MQKEGNQEITNIKEIEAFETEQFIGRILDKRHICIYLSTLKNYGMSKVIQYLFSKSSNNFLSSSALVK